MRLSILRIAALIEAPADDVRAGLLRHPIGGVRSYLASTGAGTVVTLEARLRRPAILHRAAVARRLRRCMQTLRTDVESSGGTLITNAYGSSGPLHSRNLGGIRCPMGADRSGPADASMKGKHALDLGLGLTGRLLPR